MSSDFQFAGLPTPAICTLLFVLLFSHETKSQDKTDLSEFELHPACRIELVAREPQVVDPIAARFDELGRLWVVEMRDYPVLDGNLPQSKIKILQDRDLDGYFESATVFADHLSFPTGLQPWRDGVIVTLEGKIVFLGDKDGDLRCDEEKLLFRGFATDNTQLRANHPTFGPDGLIYIANGLRNGEIQSPHSSKKVSLTGMDFRFDPNTMEFDRVTGHGQFGLTFDSAGNRYTCTNRNPLKRIVFEVEDLAAAAGIKVSKSVFDVAKAGPDSRLFPISEAWTTSNLHANQFTAACGVHIADAASLPGEFRENAFTCDPTANVVHREIVSFLEDSVVGRARPGRPKIEFLASTNPAFRPVNLNSGPDGSLYVVDMRRSVIEHPQFMPPELKQRPDLRTGNQLGRIYRITGKATKSQRRLESIDAATHLFDPRGWWREQSHRILVQSPSEIDWQKIRSGLGRNQNHPNGIIRALGLMQSHGQLRSIDLEFAVSHYSQAVRSFAMSLCEGIKPEAIRAGLMDESDVVRFQALLSCAKSGVDLEVSQLVTVAINSAQNPWIQQALLIAAGDNRCDLLESLVEQIVRSNQTSKNRQHVFNICAQLIPHAWKEDQSKVRRLAVTCLSNISAATAFREPMEQLGTAFLQQNALRRSLLSKDFESPESWKLLRRQLRDRISKISFAEEDVEAEASNSCLAAIRLLALISERDTLLEKVAVEAGSPLIRVAALQSLHYSPSDDPWLQAVDRFRSLGFAARSEIFKACLSREQVAQRLLRKVEEKNLQQNELSMDFRSRLKAHSDNETRRLAQKVLISQVAADRKLAFAKYQPALELESDARQGKPLFEKNCAACHRLGALGNQIGPDISDTRTKSKSQLLLDIVRPNAAIDNNYVEYLVATADGKTHSGIMLENNATGITLLQANNQKLIVSHGEIEKFQSTGKSLMPVGLEQEMSVQDMAHLISFLQNWRYLETNIPFLENKNAK